MDRTERLSLVAGYQSAIDPLVDFVSSLPVAALDFRPALPGAWTIREHAVHLLDAHRTRPDARDQRRVARQDAELAALAGQRHERRLAREDAAFRGYHVYMQGSHQLVFRKCLDRPAIS